MWLVIALFGYATLAVTVILDKFILTKSVGKPAVYAFYSTIFSFGTVLLYPFDPRLLHGIDWWWALFSGLTFGFGLHVMYVAVKKSEASHVNPFVGGITAVFTFFLALLFLGEGLSGLQIAAVAILIVASFLLSFEITKSKSGFHLGYVYAILAGILFAVSHTSAKYLYEIYDFIPAFVASRFSIGFVGLMLLLSPAVRKSLRVRKNKKIKVKKEGFGKRHVLLIVVAAKILGVAGLVLTQLAIALGSVSVVNALSGSQYILMFVMIYAVSRLYPRIFKEYFTKRELLAQTAAILLVSVGLVLFVI